MLINLPCQKEMYFLNSPTWGSFSLLNRGCKMEVQHTVQIVKPTEAL